MNHLKNAESKYTEEQKHRGLDEDASEKKRMEENLIIR